MRNVSVWAGALRPSACSRARPSRLAAADRGASSPRLPGTIQSSASSPRPGLAVLASLQQDSQSALMKRSSRAAGWGRPSLAQEDWPWAPAAARRASNGNGES